MTHAEIYIFIKFHRERMQMSNELAAQYLSERTKKQITPKDIEMFMTSNMPEPKHLVKALHDAGYNQPMIAEMIGIQQPTVSYHLKNPGRSQYRNSYWAYWIDNPPTSSRNI